MLFMIDILIKKSLNETIIVFSDGSIKYYKYSVIDIINNYLSSIFQNYDIALASGKCGSNLSKYKSPLVFSCSDGLTVLTPLTSAKNNQCIWVSSKYCYNNSFRNFNDLTGLNVSYYQWGRALQIGLDLERNFSRDLENSLESRSIDQKELKELLEK